MMAMDKVTLRHLRALEQLADAALQHSEPGDELHAHALAVGELFRDPALMRSPDAVFPAIDLLQRELTSARLARIKGSSQA